MLKIMIQKKKNKLDSDEEEENEQNSKHDSAENIKNLNDEKYYKILEQLYEEKKHIEGKINCTLVWLRSIKEEKLTKQNIKLLVEEIYSQEKKLGFTEFAQYNFNFLSTLNDRSVEPPKYTIRGNYDSKVNIKNSGICFSIAKREGERGENEGPKEIIKYFRPIKCEIDEETKQITSLPCKINTKYLGLIDLTSEQEYDFNKVQYDLADDADDFKVIRTPISNRTYIIGGKDHKTIKELCLEGDNVKVKPITKSCSVRINEDYDIFEKITNIYSTIDDKTLRKLEANGEIEDFRASELAKFEKLQTDISNININSYVQRFMSTHGYLKEILENSYYGIEEIKENTNEKTIKYIIEKVLFASRKLMAEFENADVLAANKVFKEADVESIKIAIKNKREEEIKLIEKAEEDKKQENIEAIITSAAIRNYDSELQINKTVEEFIKNSLLKSKMEEYLKELVKIRLEQVKKDLRFIKRKLLFSDIETLNPKRNHSVVSTKDYVFITGGEHMYCDNTFEILAVKDNSLFKGPCLTYRRDSHASIIIKNYLYIFFGRVKEGDKTTMSYEKIEIPSPDYKLTLEEFYKKREWSYSEFGSKYKDEANYNIKCFNYFKTIDNIAYISGAKVHSNGKEEDVKVIAKWNDGKESTKIIIEDLKDKESEYDQNIHKEKMHIPFMEKGEWYLPISFIDNNNLTKWDNTEERFVLLCNS